MAIFSNESKPLEPNPMRRKTDHTTLSIIAKDLTVVGDLSSQGVVKVEGTVQGTIRAGTQVLIAPGATVHGDVHSAEAIIGGRVPPTGWRCSPPPRSRATSRPAGWWCWKAGA